MELRASKILAKTKDFCRKLTDEVKQDWENSEEYQERMQAAKAIKQQVQAYELAFNAEEYHLKHAKDAGYVSAEALQWAFGGEVIKGVSKGLQVTAKAVRVIEGLWEGFKIEGQLATIWNDKKMFANWTKANCSLAAIEKPLNFKQAQQIIDNARALGLKLEYNLHGLQGLEKTGKWAGVPHFKVGNIHIAIEKGLEGILKFTAH